MALSQTEQQIADDLLTHTLDLFRLDASLRGDALHTLQKLQAELRAKLSAGNLTAFGKDAVQRLLAETSAVIADYYRKIQNHVEEALNALPEIQAQAIRDSLTGVGYGAALAPPIHFATAMTDVMIQGAPSSEWWSRQSVDTQFRFSNAVRQGIVQGRTNQQIIGDVLGRGPGQGILEVSRRNAAALVQTSVQTVANVARLESFAQNADVVKGVEQISTLDGHTTDICIAYSGGQWNLEGKPINGTKLPFKGGPPRHWNCRSLLVPKTKTFKELGIDVSEKRSTTRASVDGQISAGTTFADFLTRKGEAFQNEILGPGRAQLWRDKKITLQQLLDLHGNPLSLAELQAKYKVVQPEPKLKKSPTGVREVSPVKISIIGNRKMHAEVAAEINKTTSELTKDYPEVSKYMKGGIEFSPSNNNSYSAFDKQIKLPTIGIDKPLKEYDAITDDKTTVGGGAKALVTHEYFHAVDHYVRAGASEELLDLWFEGKKALEKKLGAPSKYGEKNTTEWFAERATAERFELVEGKDLTNFIKSGLERRSRELQVPKKTK